MRNNAGTRGGPINLFRCVFEALFFRPLGKEVSSPIPNFKKHSFHGILHATLRPTDFGTLTRRSRVGGPPRITLQTVSRHLSLKVHSKCFFVGFSRARPSNAHVVFAFRRLPPRTWHQSGYRTGLPEYERSHACCFVWGWGWCFASTKLTFLKAAPSCLKLCLVPFLSSPSASGCPDRWARERRSNQVK